MRPMTLRTLDLFCGGGGSSWGARAAGAEIIGGVDADPIASVAYARNFEGARAVNWRMSDATTAATLGDLGRIDLLLASPECTNHTCARGARPVDEASRNTARYVLNFARDLRPRWVVIENVPQMKSWDGYGPLMTELGSLGYNLKTAVLDAQHFGVPQQRRRLFIVCDREAVPSLPVGNVLSRRPSVASILDSVGTWASKPLFRPGRAAPTLARAGRAMEALGRNVPFLIVYYGSDASGGWQRLDRPLRTITTIDRFGLVTWMDGEPMLRMLQVPELMRAMGFSRGYSLDGVGSRRDRVRLLGNGVAPPVMEAIVRQLTRRIGALHAAEDSLGLAQLQLGDAA
ncbi:MAG: DNA cytosine methyltransferase [Roseococcus sp.]